MQMFPAEVLVRELVLELVLKTYSKIVVLISAGRAEKVEVGRLSCKLAMLVNGLLNSVQGP